MKQLRLLICLFVISTTALQAQMGKECKAELARFVSLTKQKNYKEAHILWDVLSQSCAGIHVAIYAYGESMLKHLIPKDQPSLSDDPHMQQLKSLYEDWMQYFPEQTGKVLAKKARLILDYKQGTELEAFKIYEQAFLEHPNSFEKAKELYTFFNLGLKFYKAKQSGYESLDALLDRHDKIQSLLTVLEGKYMDERKLFLEKTQLSQQESSKLKVDEKKITNILKAKASMKKKVEPLINCDNLIPLYAKEFDANKEDVIWLKKASRRMILKKCTQDLLFSDIMKAMHKQEPQANTANYLATLNNEKGNILKATTYYKEAFELADNNMDKAKFSFKIAQLSKSPETARDHLKRAIDLNPSYGEAYLYLAKLYADSANDCGETVFEKRSVYWLSQELALTAAKNSIDKAFTAKAKQLAEDYKEKAPSKADIFYEGKSGEMMRINCWIRDFVNVPKVE